jgi:hypothetical protein
MLLSDFSKGQRVTYTGAAHGRGGQSGTVVRPVKSRNVVTLKWDNDGSWFDARPHNLKDETGA